jgi:hypothetical protein
VNPGPRAASAVAVIPLAAARGLLRFGRLSSRPEQIDHRVQILLMLRAEGMFAVIPFDVLESGEQLFHGTHYVGGVKQIEKNQPMVGGALGMASGSRG